MSRSSKHVARPPHGGTVMIGQRRAAGLSPSEKLAQITFGADRAEMDVRPTTSLRPHVSTARPEKCLRMADMIDGGAAGSGGSSRALMRNLQPVREAAGRLYGGKPLPVNALRSPSDRRGRRHSRRSDRP